MNHDDPATIVERLDGASRRVETPCGAGSMVWRVWGAGPPVLLLHGGYGAWTHWLCNIAVLSASRTVIAPDMPGLGDSAMPDEPYSAESLADIIAAGLDAVVEGDADLPLIGFSFGAILGGHVAARRRSRAAARITALLLVGASGFGPPQPPMLDLKRAWRGISPDELAALQRGNLALLMFSDPTRVNALALHLQLRNAPRGRIKSRPIAWTDTLLRVLPEVPGRVDAIWGERDATALPFLAERVAQLRAARPEARVEIVPGAGHWVQYEAADDVNARLARLLAPVG